MKRNQNPRGTALFVLIAGALMIGAHVLFFGNPLKPVKLLSPRSLHVTADHGDAPSEILDYRTARPDLPLAPAADMNLPLQNTEAFGPPKPSVKNEKIHGKRIAIIIDDMGMDRARSRKIMDLPAPVTLAFLPYAPGLPAMTAEAKAKGHELLIHVPMQPLNAALDPGPLALREGMSDEDFTLMMDHIFQSFDGYVGINNHMGSKLTQNRDMMGRVMAYLAARHLLFLDSRTINNSVADEVAARYGLAHAARDVFLDNENTDESVRSSLSELERIARLRGFAVAIGHPKDATIHVLEDWIPKARAEGFEFVTVSAVARQPVGDVREAKATSKVYGPFPAHPAPP